MRLSSLQSRVIKLPIESKIFLEGDAGTGKTTVGVKRVLNLIDRGVRPESIIILFPQRTLAEPYHQALRSAKNVNGALVDIATLGGLARRSIELFWPFVAEKAGFDHPDLSPVFLTLETAQYFMSFLVKPLLDRGYFESITIDRNRLYSQIIDNLNKAAVVGFPVSDIASRLKAAWLGDSSQLRVYDEAQECALIFRRYCLEHNLLDFSLQAEIFRSILWREPICRDYLHSRYQHLIYDNFEEDPPWAFDIISDWLPSLQSVIIIYDLKAGFRRFLGADPDLTYQIKSLCTETVLFEKSVTSSVELTSLAEYLSAGLMRHELISKINPTPAFEIDEFRYQPEMSAWISRSIQNIIQAGTAPGNIVVLAPFLSDALRFSLVENFERLNIPVRTYRPSRSLRDEPATKCLLTLMLIAHPYWNKEPDRSDVVCALVEAIEGLDYIRAQLLAEIVYRPNQKDFSLTSFDRIRSQVQERITYRFGLKYEQLRVWLMQYSQQPESDPDVFLSRLFGEILSQPGYSFYTNFDAGATTAELIESVRQFRRVIGPALSELKRPVGLEYIQMVEEGILAALYPENWRGNIKDAVFIAPAYTFLLSNQPVDYQFWLDVGSSGWWERLYQPLTHPYILSRHWQPGSVWSDAIEVSINHDTLDRLIQGLVHRCRKKIFMGYCQLNDQGYEQKGPLLQAVGKTLRRIRFSHEDQNV